MSSACLTQQISHPFLVFAEADVGERIDPVPAVPVPVGARVRAHPAAHAGELPGCPGAIHHGPTPPHQRYERLLPRLRLHRWGLHTSSRNFSLN